MKLIVAVDNQWGIGKNNDLLVSIPEDMKFFRETTKNGVVVMGRKTLESFPNGKPLKNRLNIVLSQTLKVYDENVLYFKSIENLLTYINNNKLDNVFVIGGGSIYKQLLPYCDVAYVTKIDKNFNADVVFPNLDEDSNWECIYETEEKVWEGLKYKFTTYKIK